ELEIAKQRIVRVAQLPRAGSYESTAHVLQRETSLSSQIHRICSLQHIGPHIDEVIYSFGKCVVSQQSKTVAQTPADCKSDRIVITVEGCLQLYHIPLCRIDSTGYSAQYGIARVWSHDRVDISEREELDAAHELIAHRSNSVLAQEII